MAPRGEIAPPDPREIEIAECTFELYVLFGYVYLDVTDDGMPVARSHCDRGGGRAFFDGRRLMQHPKFQTCAPPVAVIDGGYKVNSTGCTIVNGKLFDLVDPDDRVARSTGDGFFGERCWDVADHAAATELAVQSGARMRVDGDHVFFNDVELQPIGTFAPASMTLLDNGFTLVAWSEFREPRRLRYRNLMVVDDREEWIGAVHDALSALDALEMTECRTSTADEDLLETILSVAPDALLLDMHLTSDERFEGLWIANQLTAREYRGTILLASGYPIEQLRAMRVLMKHPNVLLTGKDILLVECALYGELE